MKTPNERESSILKFWQDNNIFQKSLDKNKSAEEGGKSFRYYDGPPYATGLPHFGHLVASALKDLFPRYKTMRGYHVPRTWGWDCHGLPIETLVEKELGFKGKKEIEEFGVGKFNEVARNSVFGFRDDWKKIIPRLGRWVNMDQDYRTLDNTFMESGLWGFKQLWDKGLVYEGYKIMPWCPHCETVLSNYEVTEGYVDIADLSAYVKFPITTDGELKGVSLVAWTTTPWTLPGNVALAINSTFTYIVVKVTSTENAFEKIIILKNSLEKLQTVLKDKYTLSVESEISGDKLVGLTYTAPFNYFPKEKNMYQTWGAEFVTDTDGTGIVHVAPAFGEDDMKLAQAHDLPVIKHVNPTGEFVVEVTDLTGKVKPKEDHQKADVEVIKYLAHHGTLLAKEKYTHSYPHCWRCKTPLLNYATSSWFIKTTAIKDRIIEENNKVNWYPDEVGHKRLQAWLDNMRDWAVSRSRFWGTPLPVWKSESGKVVCLGSAAEIREKTRRNTYVVMRHGEATHLTENVLSSHMETAEKHPLTEKGRQEITATVDQMITDNAIPTIIYHSPLRRTRETAELVRDTLKEKIGKDITLVADVRIREQDFGDIDGHSRTELKKYRATQEDTLFTKVANGESIEDLRIRAAEFLYEIDAKHTGESIMIVTHEGLAYSTEHVAAGSDGKTHLARWKNPENYLHTGALTTLDFANIPHDQNYVLDFHRPYIDGVTFTWEGEEYKRLPEVLDVWYDAGSMPFASIHYPFENEDRFDHTLPVDFVSEGLDQTRGWFYTMLVMSVALFDKAPFKNVMVNGMVLAEDGRKMSKSLKNSPDILPVTEQFGADALRYYFLSSQVVRAEEVTYSPKGLTEVNNKLINKLLNTASLLEMYGVKNACIKPHKEHILDIWIHTLLQRLITTVTESLDNYQVDKAARPVLDFVEEFSTWYARRSRDRFKDTDQAEVVTNNMAYVLVTVVKLLAPMTPFVAEEIYQQLKAFGVKDLVESVHLDNWPEVEEMSPLANEVLERMQHTRHIVEEGLALRNKEGIKVRQPLASLTVAGEMYDSLYIDIIADELNVKMVIKGEVQLALQLDTHITEELRIEGLVRDISREIQAERKNLNLMPEDKVEVTVFTDEPQVEKGLQDILSTVGAVKISVEKVEFKADSKVEVKKV
ncbi:MAG: hypothetical protein RJB39_235 [Candidatus Parcubacteria bacterium]|jgi:isoleucyl-tRNA synthetase